MNNLCLWCDAPTEGDKLLCPPCDTANSLPPTNCTKGLGHLPTLGPECAECTYIAWREEEKRKKNEPAIKVLLELREKLIKEDWHKKWTGMEFAKAHVGQMLNAALADLGYKESP